jgi:agmatine deiminase
LNAKLKYRLPAEWEPHKSTILCWPHQKEDWPGKFSPIPWVYAEIIKKIIPGELVRIIAQSQSEVQKIKTYLVKNYVDLTQIEFIITKTDRGWMRDISPTFVKCGGKKLAVKFKFNGWAKYSNWKKDKNIPGVLSKVLETELVDVVFNNKNVVLEGGAIDANGKGTLLTTEECLLDNQTQVRNSGFTKKNYEEVFGQYLGISNVIWLKNGILGDDTHGHIDDLCRFVNENTVVLCLEKNQGEANYKILEENFEILKDARLEDGTKLNIVQLPMPSPMLFDKMRLPASYANFYISNKAVLVPTFNDANDRVALNILSELFPEREIVGIHAVDLVWGLGTIHCLSHEEPA